MTTSRGGSQTTAPRAARILRRAAAAPLVGLIVLYQRFISPMTPATCRYYPSCSTYALVAIRTHGPVKGTWLAVRRLLRCHPWSSGGVDHVPGTGRTYRDPLPEPDAPPAAA
jgi:putative membrane protein insertion efficiency factor